ncbi:MAG: ribonuclease P protein component [Candidatus Kerfeldbacteria bacterium]|nr:ribonuclease P protein component [Candidatus Kerfeldbacteria bacterium]
MLPKAQRLRTRKEFEAVYASGNTVHSRFFKVSTLKSASTTTQFGVVVSNAVLKNATDRNRKKRQIRSILAKIQPKRGFQVVISLKHQGKSAEFSELSQDLNIALKKASLI